jgi:hypothetical protein
MNGKRALIALSLLLDVWRLDGFAAASAPTVYSGMCDASAAVALGDTQFVVANDEDNVLRVYDYDQPGPPVQSIDLSAFLQVDRKFPETDLEGAARVGNRIYWITSHGRNQEGKRRLSRERFFATDTISHSGSIQLTPAGRPYKYLLRDLIEEPRLKSFGLASASRLAPRLANAFNIEGLCATPDGRLLIGFRNPIPQAKALVVPLLNPAEVIEGSRAKFGLPVLLDLGGLGIREMAQHEGRYLFVAGRFDGGGKSQLYEWDGRAAQAKPLADFHRHLGKFSAESILFYADKGWNQIQILSDDGSQRVGGKRCKDLKDPAQKTFRSLWLSLAPGATAPQPE